MKTINLISCLFLTLTFAGCTKKSQEMVLESGYVIQEGGQAIKDYRGKFEGAYMLDCMWGTATSQHLIKIKTNPTKNGYVYLDSLFVSGYNDEYTGPGVVAKITPEGVISFGEQVMEYRVIPGTNPELHIYSEGSGKIDTDNKISLGFRLRIEPNDRFCDCRGERK